MKIRLVTAIFAVSLFMICSIVMDAVKDDDSVFNIRLVVEENDNKEYISLIKHDEVLRAYLPAYVDMVSVHFEYSKNADMFIDGVRVTNDYDYSKLRMNHEYLFQYWVNQSVHECKLVFMKSINIATMFIDTASGKMDYIHNKKRNSEIGRMRLYYSDGELVYGNEIKSISGRGNTTWDDHEKKPYTIKLDEPADFLNMGEAEEWVLLANAKDASHIRNKLVFDFASQIEMKYSPKGEWVDLYLNGEYAGLYLLTEKNEVGQERVDIEDERSFLVSLERKGRMVTQNLPYVLTKTGQALRIRYPKALNSEQKYELEQEWQSIENAILAPDGIDKATGDKWTSLIDLDSWAKKYLIEEIFGNIDAGSVSQYFYRDGRGNDFRVYAGPVWDYDLSMGNTWQTDQLNFMIANRLVEKRGVLTPWFYELYHKDEFITVVQTLFEEECVPLLEQVASKTIDNYVYTIEEAAKMDGVRWDTDGFYADIEKIREFILRRIDFLKKYWTEGTKWNIIEAYSEGVSYAYYFVEDGEYIEELPVLASTSSRNFLGWYYENGEPFDSSKRITENMRIEAHWSGTPSFVVMYGEYLLPLIAIGLMGIGVLLADILCSRKGRVSEHDR